MHGAEVVGTLGLGVIGGEVGRGPVIFSSIGHHCSYG